MLSTGEIGIEQKQHVRVMLRIGTTGLTVVLTVGLPLLVA